MYAADSLPDSLSQEATLRDAVRQRAQEIYERSGRIPGRDLENWTEAEREILQQRKDEAEGAARSAVVVSVDGVKYVGEYQKKSSDGYLPGEFAEGSPVAVRFSGEKMFVKRPNGRELETIIVQRIG